MYNYTIEELYAHTDNGLEIIHKFVPGSKGCEVSTNRKFKFREEKTPSACLWQNEKSWTVHDFGSGQNHSPIDIAKETTGMEFYECLKFLYSEFGLSHKTFVASNKTFKDKGDKPDGYFKIVPKKEIGNAAAISRFVTAEICGLYNVHEIEYIERVTKTGKLMKIEATEHYPIFAYSDDLTKWAKTYCPAEKERSFKHGYIGKKPAVYVHGLQRIKEKIPENTTARIKEIKENLRNDLTPDFLKKDLKEELKALQLPYVFICSGGSDGLSIASLSGDFYPVWGNSESDIISYETYRFLKDVSRYICYIPDSDRAGVDFAYKYSHKYQKLAINFIPKHYLREKGKDFRDFINYFPEMASKDTIVKVFTDFLASNLSFEFVKTVDKKHRIDTLKLEYFLNAHNYFTYDIAVDEQTNEDTGLLVHIDGYKVRTPTSQEVRAFCIDYLVRKKANDTVLNMVNSCNALRANDLRKIKARKIDFNRHGKDFQVFFFKDNSIKVTADEISIVKKSDINHFVWEKSILNRNIRLLPTPFFEAYEENGQKRVKILRNDCDYMNYLINGSRVHWQLEEEADPDFRKKIILDSPHLSKAEQIEQEQHFLGKCYAIGYLLHRYKRFDFQKFVYIVDDDIRDSANEAHGGTGKGIFSQGIKEMVRVHSEDGRKKDLFGDRHFLGGLEESHDVILFQDMEQQGNLNRLYNFVTDEMSIRPIQQKARTIQYSQSPKIMGTFNFGLKDMNNGSTVRRVLFVSYSSYYHSAKGDIEEYTPTMDFGKSLFSDWNDTEWNLFDNFMLFCLQFYLKNIDNQYLSPTNNVTVNNLKASIGDNFIEWADGYFNDENLDVEILREELYSNYEAMIGSRYKVGAKVFKSSLDSYCKIKGWVLNPKEKQGKDGRITRTVIEGIKRTSKEVFYIQTPNPTEKIQPEAGPFAPDTDDDITDGLEF